MAGPVQLVCTDMQKLLSGSPSSNMIDFVLSTDVPEWFPLSGISKLCNKCKLTAMPKRKTEGKTIFFKYFPNCHFNNGLTTEYANFPPQIPVNANAKQIVINVSV